MRNAFPALFRVVGIAMFCLVSAMAIALTPVHLKCEYQTKPLGVDTIRPRLAWWFDSSRRGEIQTAYQVVVASSAAKLKAGKYDLWNSKKIQSGQSTQVEYEGKELKSNIECLWKVRVWDRDGKVSGWSEPATWTTGLFEPEDWRAKWIAATNKLSITKSPTIFGYHALESKVQNTTKWVQVDLGSSQQISEVVLHSPNPPGFDPSKGFGFPLRFKIEVSDDPAFIKSVMIADHTGKDFPNPGGNPERFLARGANGRYVRVTATKLWDRGTGPEPFCFALAELQVFAPISNMALGMAVTSLDSVENNEWNRKRLTDGQVLDHKLHESDDPENGAIMLHKEIFVSKKIVRATAFLCGIGYSELGINNEKVGDHVLDPGFTDYSKRALYVAHDVTKSFKRGENKIEILLGGGWFNLATPDLFGFEHAPWSASPRAKFHLKLEYEDGTAQTIVSDASWKWSPTPISFNCVRGGETIDARISKPNWNPVTVVEGPKGKLVSQQQPPIRVTKAITPISLKEPKPGVYVFDLGTNIAGWAAFQTKGSRGTRITLKYNEALKPDGTVDMHHTSSHTYGRFQVDEFILSGKKDLFQPRFTYHGFRYVEVTGLTEKPTLDSLVGKWVTTDPAKAGSFECSNERVNKLQELIVHSYLNNLHSIPTDCPQREKMGWMDDGCVDMETGFFNLDVPQFYRKWFNDMVDAQDENGHVADIVPTSGWGRTRPDGSPGEMADPWWGGAIVFTPWKLYQNYGDKRIIAQGYIAMKAYVDYLSSTAKDNVITWGLGDWLDDSAGGGGRRVPVAQTSTAAYYLGARIIAQSAAVLGIKEDVSKYEKLANQIRMTFNSKFLDATNGLYAKDSQTAQALPLTLGLVPKDSLEQVLMQLDESISGPRKGHISAGMVGSLYLFHALTENGRDDLAYAMLTKEDYPGWLHMVNSGATSLWEAWNGDGSYDHPTLGCVGFWLYQGLAGIKPDPSGPGYKKFVIKPSIVGDLTWVKCHYDSVHGRIESNWKRNGNSITVSVSIPVNTEARVFILSKLGSPIKQPGKKDIMARSATTEFTLGSGTYIFESNIDSNSLR